MNVLASVWKFISTPGIAMAFIAGASQIAVATGHPALGSFIADPHTAALTTTFINAGVGLVAGAAKGIKS